MSIFTRAKAIPTVAAALAGFHQVVADLTAAKAHHDAEAAKHEGIIATTEKNAKELIENVREAAERRIDQVEVLRADAVKKAEELKAAAEAEVKAAEAAIARVSAFLGL